MHADISRDSFDIFEPYSGVVIQQGRVQLDSDANAAAAITRWHQRMAIQYIVGQAAGVFAPHQGEGPFKIWKKNQDGPKPGVEWGFNGGVYFVDGIMVSHKNSKTRLSDQPFGYLRTKELPPDAPSRTLFCLQVWEELVTVAENPSIAEVAIPADTAARLAVRWRVVYFTESLPGSDTVLTPANVDAEFKTFRLRELFRLESVMRARCVPPPATAAPCLVAPESRFRGDENQLYRVEIQSAEPGKQPTFKFSRENGSVVFPVAQYDGNNSVKLTALGRDAKLSLRVGDWIQIEDDASKSRWEAKADPLRQIESINSDTLELTLSAATAGSTTGTDRRLHPVLRRWDHSFGDKPPSPDGALPLIQGDGEQSWLDLEDGIQVQFPSAGRYRRGAYWLIAARPSIGDIIWPVETAAGTSVPAARPADGPRISYAALEYHDHNDAVDKRQLFAPISKPAAEFFGDTSPAFGDIVLNPGLFTFDPGKFTQKDLGDLKAIDKALIDLGIGQAVENTITPVEKVNPIAEEVDPAVTKVDPPAAAAKPGTVAANPPPIGRARPSAAQRQLPDAGGAAPTAHT